jgi:hypothetical protein
MEKESLEIVQESIANMVDVLDIPIYDKIELLINLVHFLNPEEYEDNIKVLKKEKESHHNR